jgi:hypothetical protein
MGSQLIETLRRTLGEIDRAAKSDPDELTLTGLRREFARAIVELERLRASRSTTSVKAES